MNVDRQNRIKDLLSDALELDPSSRDSFLDSATGDDPTLRFEVRQLIDVHERSSGFLLDPTVDGTEIAASNGEVIGRYTLLHMIGEGGFGSVYLAQQHEPMARQVALKIIKVGMDTRHVIARFEAERQTLAMMKHPGIASVFDAGSTRAGRPYFVMEFVDGVAITEFCDRHGLSIEERLDLFIQVCGAVQHAHTKGVIHRDIKPSNVLVTVNDDVPLPKVIDFGIAKATTPGGRLTNATVSLDGRGLVGTPQYMSPEQASEDAIDIDTRADVYSLGVVLYELLAGLSPFDDQRLRSAGIVEWHRIIREEEPPKPSTRLLSSDALPDIAARRGIDPRRLPQRLSGDLDWITLKALEKDRERRYSSAAEFAEDVKRHLCHEPVLACPPSKVYRFKKFARRHRVGVLATCLTALAMACGVVGLTVGMVQASQSARQASDAAQQAQAVNDFMREILTSVKPEVEGADVRLVEVMDNASDAASQRFAGHPLLEAQVRDMLGGVFYDLTMWPKAKSEFKRAMELWQEHAGPDDPRAITSERHYVGSAINNQQISEIESRLAALADRTNRVFGPIDLSTLDVRRAVGIVHMLRGRTDEAEHIFLDVRARLLAHGDDDALQIRTLRNLIRVGRIKSSGADLATRADIVSQIEPLAQEQVERAIRAYGPNSIIAIDAKVRWAEILSDRNQYAPAAQICRDVLDATPGRLGECHVLRQEALNVLAVTEHRLGRSAAAAELKLKRIECARQSSNDMALIVAISDSLPILDQGERWVEGEALSREFVETLNTMGGGHGDMLFDAEIWIARFVSLQGRLDEAEAMFQSLLARADAGPTASVRARLHLFHGSNLCRREAFDDSEAELQTAADALDNFRLGTRTTTPDDILLGFIELYTAWGKPDLAGRYQAMREQTLANLPFDPS